MSGDINVVDLARNAPKPETTIVQTVAHSETQQTQGIWQPIPLEELPSRGFYYSEPIYGKPLTATQAKQLGGMNQKNAEAMIDSILKENIKGVSFGNILLADKMFLMFWLRQNSFKRTNYTLKYECSECENKENKEFTAADLKINYHPDMTEDLFDIDVGGKIFKVKYPTVSDQDEMNLVKKKNANTITFDDEFLTLANAIVSIDGEELHLLKKYRYLVDSNKFSADDLSDLTSGLNRIAIGVDPYIEIECSKCGGRSVSLIPFRPDYFLPTSNNTRGS